MKICALAAAAMMLGLGVSPVLAAPPAKSSLHAAKQHSAAKSAKPHAAAKKSGKHAAKHRKAHKKAAKVAKPL